jgi:hypothetical protein
MAHGDRPVAGATAETLAFATPAVERHQGDEDEEDQLETLIRELGVTARRRATDPGRAEGRTRAQDVGRSP